ncbi:MAG: TRAP transporter substrate-binding protein [Betaproteobacteria bacterium]|nr:TRAP transporter substrate-binding protein [Betaproteobacteria bacterium]
MKTLRLLGAVALLASATAQAQSVTLNASSWVPASHPLTAGMMMPWCEDVTKATSGRVKCNLLPKGVVAPPQTFDAIKDGLADISFTVHGYTPGRFVLSDMAEMPFLGDTSEVTSVAYQRIYDKMLAKADEHKGVVTLGVFTHGPGQMYNTKRPINALKDLDGLKIRVGGGMVNEITKLIGASPLLKPASESYEILSSGVADGVFFPKESPMSFKLVPLIKHVTYVPGGLYNVSFVFMMNPATWGKISKADQGAIMKLSGEAYARRAGKTWDAADTKGEAAVREAKIPVVQASAALVSEIKAKTANVEKAWFEKAKTKGVDGEAALKAFRAEIAALSKK